MLQCFSDPAAVTQSYNLLLMLLQGWNRTYTTESDTLQEIQSRLNHSRTPGWTVHMTGDNRLYYCK